MPASLLYNVPIQKEGIELTNKDIGTISVLLDDYKGKQGNQIYGFYRTGEEKKISNGTLYLAPIDYEDLPISIMGELAMDDGSKLLCNIDCIDGYDDHEKAIELYLDVVRSIKVN